MPSSCSVYEASPTRLSLINTEYTEQLHQQIKSHSLTQSAKWTEVWFTDSFLTHQQNRNEMYLKCFYWIYFPFFSFFPAFFLSPSAKQNVGARALCYPHGSIRWSWHWEGLENEEVWKRNNMADLSEHSILLFYRTSRHLISGNIWLKCL